MEDGVIKNICPSDNETQESLNLKKAILSMLQVQYSGLAYFWSNYILVNYRSITTDVADC